MVDLVAGHWQPMRLAQLSITAGSTRIKPLRQQRLHLQQRMQ